MRFLEKNGNFRFFQKFDLWVWVCSGCQKPFFSKFSETSEIFKYFTYLHHFHTTSAHEDIRPWIWPKTAKNGVFRVPLSGKYTFFYPLDVFENKISGFGVWGTILMWDEEQLYVLKPPERLPQYVHTNGTRVDTLKKSAKKEAFLRHSGERLG